MSLIALKPEQGLFYQPLLWMSVAIPLFFSSFLWVFVAREYIFDFSVAGYKQFLEISVLPLGVLAMSLPLAAFVASLHSTSQTAAQIRMLMESNNRQAYYSHREQLFEFFGQARSRNVLGVLEVAFKIHPGVHADFFCGLPEGGTPSLNQSAFTKVANKLSIIASYINLLNVEPRARFALNFYFLASYEIYSCTKMLGVTEVQALIEDSTSTVDLPEYYDQLNIGRAAIVGASYLELLAAYRCLRYYFELLCGFSGFVDGSPVPAYMKKILIGRVDELQVEKVKEICDVIIPRIIADDREARNNLGP